MAREERDESREHRIEFEIIVDAYGEEEQALGWYNYLEDRLIFPFRARCISERRNSPLRVGEVVEVTGMAPDDDCMHDMFVEVRWQGRTFGAPLSQLEGTSLEGTSLHDEARQAMEDWHYWVARGYKL
jgi:hypothetical protein